MYLTTSQAATAAGLPKEQFRSAMSKERKNGKEFHAPRSVWADGRTPLWDEDKVLAWAKARKKRKKRKKEEHRGVHSDAATKDAPKARKDSAKESKDAAGAASKESKESKKG